MESLGDQQSHAVNDLLNELWGYIRAAVKSSVESSVTNAAESNSIPYLKGLSVQDLDLFGSDPPALHHARVEGNPHDTALRTVLRWHATQRVRLNASFHPPQQPAAQQDKTDWPTAGQPGSAIVDPSTRCWKQLEAQMSLESLLTGTVDLPLQPLIEALLPADAVERVQTGLLGHPDSTAAHVTKGWDKYAHPNGRPLHADEALLTDVLAAAWPYIASMAQTSAWDMIPALLKTTAPRWLADLELKKFVLGEVAPKLYDVRVYQDEHDVVDDVYVDAGFDWRSNFDLELRVQAFPSLLDALPGVLDQGVKHLTTIEIGAEDVRMRGRLRMSLRPLLNTMPVIGAVRIGLWEMPDLHFEVTALGGQVALLPMLKTWLYDTVKSAVLTPYMVPGGYQLTLKEGVFVPEVYVGALSLQVIEARGVPKMDLLEKSSPFVEVFMEHSFRRTTRVLPPTSTPVWKESFVLPVELPQVQQLHLILWDHDDLVPDDKIGSATLQMSDMQPGKQLDVWLDVENDAEQQALAKGEKGHKRDAVVKTLTAPLQRGSTKNTAIHVKVLYRQFDESFIRIMVRCQQHGALRVLQDDPQLVDTLEPWQLDLLLMGRINLTIHEGHGLPIGRKMLVLSKKTKVEACVGGECKSTPLRKATDSRKGIVDWHQTMDIQLSAMQVLESDNSPVVLRVLDDDDVVLGTAEVPLTTLLHQSEPLDQPLLLHDAPSPAQLHVTLAWRWLLS